MTKERPKALFFIFLLLSSPALAARLEVQEQAALNGTAVEMQRPGSIAARAAARRAGGRSVRAIDRARQSIRRSHAVHQAQFCRHCVRGSYGYTYGVTTSSFEATTVVRTSGGTSYTRTTMQHTVERTCGGILPPKPTSPVVPPPIEPLPPMPPHDPSFDAEVAATITPYWPLLIAAGVVLMGGLYLYHRHRMNAPVEATFCPVSSWQADPVGMLVGPAAHEAFGDRFSSLLTEDNNRGMPKCHGLRRHRLRADCDGDVDCKRQACRQMCCDRRDCTFYQFNTIDSTDNCFLGSRNRLSSRTCDQPFFGEMCTTCRDRQVALWPQVHEDNMKCHSGLLGTGFHVDNQHECQAHAVEQGHAFYQYDSERQRCETEATCDSPSSHTLHSWRIFSSENAPPPQPAAARPPPDQEAWEFEPFLLHENNGMTTVQLARSERCGSGDVTCMRDACRAQCLQHDWCIHYQFESGSDSCMLGADHVVDEDDVGMWFGGILAANRQCDAHEYKCPSSHNCVLACGGECDGHSREGPDGWCVRSAVENIVDQPDGWTDNYSQHPIDAWCRGIERSVVTVSQGLAQGQTGADVCRAACSADSDCALYQMYPSDAARADLSEGDHVRCWLGMQDQLGRPRFSCTGRSPKRWRLLSSPVAESVRHRGCHEGKVACVISQRCVDLCADECPGFDITDTEAGICQAPANPEMMSDGVPMNLMMPQAMPDLVVDPEYALVADETDMFTMSVNLNNVINPDTFSGDTSAVCDVIPEAECDLIDGACVCEYDEDMNCDMLFASPDTISPVIADEGMMLLSHDRCSCEGRTCTLSLLNSVPPLRPHADSTSAVQLRGNEGEVCDPSLTCPNMDTCEGVSYGASGCGYNCQAGGEQYWCSNRCACNKEEAVTECPAGVMCPNMHSCNPISYGEYGCGYGCMRDSTYFFCNDACTNCNE